MDLPKVFDENLNKLPIPNVDIWLQAQTNRKYSYADILKMADAFVDGLSSNFTKSDIQSIEQNLYDRIFKNIFSSQRTPIYINHYSIELMNQSKLQKLIRKISEGFDELNKNLGPDRLCEYLHRILDKCVKSDIDDIDVLERLIDKLKIKDHKIVFTYPSDEKGTRDLILFDPPEYGNIDHTIIENTRKIEMSEK